MKRFVGLAICLLFIASTTLVYAAPVGNISTPAVLKKGLIMQDQQQEYGIIVASENDIVFDRNIKDQLGDTELNFYGAKTGVIVNDKALIYALLGAGNMSEKFTILGSSLKYETETGFVWGVGGSLIAYEKKIDNNILRIGIDGRYRRIDLDIEEVTIDGTKYKLSDAGLTGVVYELNEWQVALALSYQVGSFVPYVGVKYSDIDGDAKATESGTEFSADMEANDNVGIFIGTDVVIADSASINIEGRFIDEEALTIGAAIRF